MNQKFILTKQKERLICADIEKYLMGQIMIKEIAANRNVPIHVVIRIEHKVINEKMRR